MQIGMWCTFIYFNLSSLMFILFLEMETSGKRVFLIARIAARKNASNKFPSSFIKYRFIVTFQTIFPYIMHSPSLSVTRELFTIFSMKFWISIFISLMVYVWFWNSAIYWIESKSTLNLMNPSCGFPITGAHNFKLL